VHSGLGEMGWARAPGGEVGYGPVGRHGVQQRRPQAATDLVAGVYQGRCHAGAPGAVPAGPRLKAGTGTALTPPPISARAGATYSL